MWQEKIVNIRTNRMCSLDALLKGLTCKGGYYEKVFNGTVFSSLYCIFSDGSCGGCWE